MADIELIQWKNQHYIKTVSGKVVAQSIAKGATRILEAPALHTLRLMARQP